MLPITVRLLTLTDLPAYKALRDEALRNSPEAFTSDYATEVQKPASAYACRLYDAASGHFLLGAFDAQEQSLGSIALEVEARLQKNIVPPSPRWWSIQQHKTRELLCN